MIIPEGLKSCFPIILKESRMFNGLEDEIPVCFDFSKFIFKNEENKMKLLSSVVFFCYPGLGNKDGVDPTLYDIMIKTGTSLSDQYTSDLFTDDAIEKALAEGQFDTDGDDSLAGVRKVLFQYLISDKIGGKASFNNMINHLMLKGEPEEDARKAVKTLAKLGFITRGTEFRTYYYVTELGRALAKHISSISGIALVYKDAKRIWAEEVAKQILSDFETSKTGMTLEFCITPVKGRGQVDWEPIDISEDTEGDYDDDWDEIDLEDEDEYEPVEDEDDQVEDEPVKDEDDQVEEESVETKEEIKMVNASTKKAMAKGEYSILMELLIKAKASGNTEKSALLMDLLSEAIDRML